MLREIQGGETETDKYPGRYHVSRVYNISVHTVHFISSNISSRQLIHSYKHQLKFSVLQLELLRKKSLNQDFFEDLPHRCRPDKWDSSLKHLSMVKIIKFLKN